MLKCRGIGNCTLLEQKPQRNRIVTSVWLMFHLLWGQITSYWSNAECFSHCYTTALKSSLLLQVHQHSFPCSMAPGPTPNLLISFSSFTSFWPGDIAISVVCTLMNVHWHPEVPITGDELIITSDVCEQQHCTVSPVLLTSCGPPEVDAIGSVSAVLLYSMWTLKEMHLLSACSLCSVKIKHLLPLDCKLNIIMWKQMRIVWQWLWLHVSVYIWFIC